MDVKRIWCGALMLLLAAPASAEEIAPDATATQELLVQRVAQLDALQQEVAALRKATGTPQQMVVKIEVIELDVSKCRSMGFDFDWSGMATRPMVAASRSTEGKIKFATAAVGISHILPALRQNNLARTIAEPTLAITSGHPASFHAGGEFAVADDAHQSVVYKKFGTEVDLLATTLGDDKVRLDIHPRISEIDAQAGGDVRHPALKVRAWDTACETALGSTIVLSGNIEQRIVATLEESEGRKRVREEIHEFRVVALVTVEAVESTDRLPPVEAEVQRTAYEEALVAAVKKPECIVRTYPVGDLPVWKVRPTGTAFDVSVLAANIQSMVDPESWREWNDGDSTGEGAIKPFERNGSLVISQTQENHRRIAELLAKMRGEEELESQVEAVEQMRSISTAMATSRFVVLPGADGPPNIAPRSAEERAGPHQDESAGCPAGGGACSSGR